MPWEDLMQKEHLDMVAQMENDLADMYRRLCTLKKLTFGKEFFDMMITQSEGHARSIVNRWQEDPPPKLDLNAVWKVHNLIREQLHENVLAESSVEKCFEVIQHAERDVARLYESLARFHEMSIVYHQKVAGEFRKLSQEELEHEKMAARMLTNFKLQAQLNEQKFEPRLDPVERDEDR